MLYSYTSDYKKKQPLVSHTTKSALQPAQSHILPPSLKHIKFYARKVTVWHANKNMLAVTDKDIHAR